MKGKPRDIYGKTKIIRRVLKVPVTVVKVAGLNPDRLVLRFASPDATGILISPHPDFTADVIGEPVQLGTSVTISYGNDGPLVCGEWFAMSTIADMRLHVVEVITTCEGGGSGIDAKVGPII